MSEIHVCCMYEILNEVRFCCCCLNGTGLKNIAHKSGVVQWHVIFLIICDRARINQPYAAKNRNSVLYVILKLMIYCVFS